MQDAETGKAVKTLTGHTSYVFCCSFHPQGHLLVRAGGRALGCVHVVCECACVQGDRAQEQHWCG